MPHTSHQPLSGLNILDLCEGVGDSCGRYLADLGAEVLLIETPAGNPTRKQGPLINGNSTYFATHAANKKSVVLDPSNDDDVGLFKSLVSDTNIILHSRTETALNWLTSIQSTIDSSNQLIVLAISDFGDSGPYSNYAGSNAVHMAMAAVTARSGLKNREPLLPPAQLSYETAATQAAWVALVGHWQSLHTGAGGNIDFSVFEAICQILDPALGVTGSGAAGQSATKLAPRGRPPEGKMYPFFKCADGYVRVCLLNPRQWAAMSDWLGSDHPFTDPSFGNMGKRYKHMREINAVIQELFIKHNGSYLVDQGRERGVPLAMVATPQDLFKNVHLQARGALTEVNVGENNTGKAPTGYVEINDQLVGIRSFAPKLGEHEAKFTESAVTPTPNTQRPADQQPLSGIRILDLGVIVAGAELGRLFADQGAEVIKIETRAFADGLRQSLDNSAMTESFAQGSRGKVSLGLNLRSDEGKRLFKELVAKSDVVVSNFKPGTMDSLGFGYETLKAINPRIIVSDSSALGSSGPMAKTMGYGPLVRAGSGLVGLWRYPEDEASFGDAITIFPDHFAARISATAIMAMLIQREKTGVGGTVSLSQTETILMALSSELLADSMQPGWLTAVGNRGRYNAPSNLFACAGDDEWCVIDIQNDQQWQNLCAEMGRSDLAQDDQFTTAAQRLTQVALLEAEVGKWTEQYSPQDITERLQAKGIAAGPMRRVNELPDDPHLKARDFFRVNEQPGLDSSLLTENGPAGKTFFPSPKIKPAPFVAEHTRPLMHDLLDLEDEEINALIEAGDLEDMG